MSDVEYHLFPFSKSFFISILLSYITSLSQFPFPSLLPAPPPLFSPRFTPYLPSEKNSLPRISTEQGITSYNKLRQKLSYQGCMRKLVGGEGSQAQVEESETPSAPTIRRSTRTPRYTTITYMSRT